MQGCRDAVVQSRCRAGAEQVQSRCMQSRYRAGAKAQVQRSSCKCSLQSSVQSSCRGAEVAWLRGGAEMQVQSSCRGKGRGAEY